MCRYLTKGYHSLRDGVAWGQRTRFDTTDLEVWLRQRTRADGQGISLIEIMVAMGLLSLIMLLLVQTLLPGLKIWNRARVVADLEQQAMVAEDRMVRAITASIGSSIRSTYLPPAPLPELHAISMMSHGGSYNVAGYNSTGAPDWSRVDYFYVRLSDGVLYGNSWAGTSPTLPYDFEDAPFRLSTVHLQGLTASNTSQPPRPLAKGVSRLSLVGRNDGGSTTGEGFVLGLSLQVTVQNRKEPVKIQREVYVVPRLRERT